MASSKDHRGNVFRTPRRVRFFALCFASFLACASPDVSGPTSIDSSQLFWKLSLNAHAITMATTAPYDTLQLTASVLNVTGASIANVPAPTFSTSDSSVRVSSTGLLTARTAAQGVIVVATLTYQGIRLADTAFITVTGAPPASFRTLQLAFEPGDSARMALPLPSSSLYFSRQKTLMVGALDSAGRRIPQSFVALFTDPLQANISPITDPAPNPATLDTGTTDVGVAFTATVGRPVVVYAEATVYGVTRRDSLRFDVTPPLFAQILYTQQLLPGSTTPTLVFLPRPTEITIRQGGVVLWNNTHLPVEDSLDIVFDDPTAASPAPDIPGIPATGGGNVGPFPGGNERALSWEARQFLRVGTFPFHSTHAGASGTIIVVP